MAAEFSLNTQMFLLSKKELWLSDGSMGFGEGTDAAFSEGNTLLPSSGYKFFEMVSSFLFTSFILLSRFHNIWSRDGRPRSEPG